MLFYFVLLSTFIMQRFQFSVFLCFLYYMYLVLNYTIDYHTRVLNNKSFEANDLDILVVKL